MAAGGLNWNKFKEKMKELCQGRNGKKDSGKSAKNLETVVVQRLSAEVSGKAQKNSRVGHASSCLSKISTNSPVTTMGVTGLHRSHTYVQ